MDKGSLSVIILRLVFPPFIFYFPFFGIFICFLLDCFDAPLVEILSKNKRRFWGETVDYYLIDAWLDLYYLTFAFLVSLRWENLLIKNIIIFSFLIRVFGVIFFSLTKRRYFLFLFPNVFEVFFIYFLIIIKWFSPQLSKNLLEILIIAFFLAILKIITEYFLHIKKLKGMEIIKIFVPIKTQEKTIWGWFKNKYLKR